MFPFLTFAIEIEDVQRRGPDGKLVRVRRNPSKKGDPTTGKKEEAKKSKEAKKPEDPIANSSAMPSVTQQSNPTINIYIPEASITPQKLPQPQQQIQKQKAKQQYQDADAKLRELERELDLRARKFAAMGLGQVEIMKLEASLWQQIQDARRARDAAKLRYNVSS